MGLNGMLLGSQRLRYLDFLPAYSDSFGPSLLPSHHSLPSPELLDFSSFLSSLTWPVSSRTPTPQVGGHPS